MTQKKSLSWQQQVDLLAERGLVVNDETGCRTFLAAVGYYRFSGYARYFQRAPHDGDDRFEQGTAFEEIRDVYDADQSIREVIGRALGRAELLLRTHTAHVIAEEHGHYLQYLEKEFYSDVGGAEPTVTSCLRDIDRSRERHILRFKSDGSGAAAFRELPIWSAVEAWSFGTLSRCIERGAAGHLAGAVATSLGVAQAGFPYRVRSLVYLRNRCAHHGRLWNHSVIDAGPTPNNVRSKAKRLAGQFAPRSVLDVVASLDDVLKRGMGAEPLLPSLVTQHAGRTDFWQGLAAPQNPRDHSR